MAFYLLQPDGVALSAGAHRRGRAGQHGGGSGRAVGGRSGFRPDTPADILKVNTTGWSLDPCSGWIDPGASTNQGMYGFAIDHSPTGTPTPPDANLPRKDIYYLQVNDSSAADGTSGTPSLTINYLAGTPASNPVSPWDVPATKPPRSFLLGTATVPQNGGGSPTVVMNPARYAAAGAPLPVYSQAERDALVLSDGLIVQRRDLPGRPWQAYDSSVSAWGALVGARQYAELVSTAPFDLYGANQLWDVGPLGVDSSASVNNTFVNTTGAASGAFNITESGVYSITTNTIGNGSPGNGWVSMRRGPSEIVVTGSTNGYAWEISTAATIYIPAGQYIRLRAQTTNAVSSAVTRVRIAKLSG